MSSCELKRAKKITTAVVVKSGIKALAMFRAFPFPGLAWIGFVVDKNDNFVRALKDSVILCHDSPEKKTRRCVIKLKKRRISSTLSEEEEVG